MKLVWAGEFPTKDEARDYERTLKRWATSRKKKLIAEDKLQTDQIKQVQGIDD